MGAQLLIDTLAQNPTPIPQNDAEATLAPLLLKEDGEIDWTRQAQAIHDQIRGLQPWPGGYTTFRGSRLHIWKSKVGQAVLPAFSSPAYLSPHGAVSCGEATTLELIEVQLEGRKRMDARTFLNGAHLSDNETLGASQS
jgi:methionyl-tRNA formyltransferase